MSRLSYLKQKVKKSDFFKLKPRTQTERNVHLETINFFGGVLIHLYKIIIKIFFYKIKDVRTICKRVNFTNL